MRETIKKIIEKEVIIIKEKDSKFFLTDNNSNWIFDFRKAFLQWYLLEKFSKFFWDKYEKEFPFQVWWMELWAIPLISWIIFEWTRRWKSINWFFVRKDRKKTWLWNQIEWKINNEKIIIVDDLFNSWETIKKVKISLEEYWREIYKIFTFLNFWWEKWKKFLAENKLDYEYEFTLSNFWLDLFWNTKKLKKDNFTIPMIYPEYQTIISKENPNKFLEAPKSNPLMKDKNIYLWWEWWIMTCVCADTWSVRWKFSTNNVVWHKNIISSPIIVNNKLIFGSYDWNLYCLDKDTWEEIWVNIEADWIGSSPAYSKENGHIYIWLELWWTKNKWSLAAIDFDSWKILWETLFDDYVHCSPIYNSKHDLVICWWNDKRLLWIKAKTWKIIYEKKLNWEIKWWFNFSDDLDIVYFWCFDKNLHELNLITWELESLFVTDNFIYVKPQIIWDNIFFGSLDKHFYHVDKKWSLIKKIRTYWKIFSESIEIKDSIIAFWSNDSYIYFYDYKNKKTIFVIKHPERVQTKLIFNKEMWHLYVYDCMNQLYKYDIRGYL